MAKKSLLAREQKRVRLVQKYATRRQDTKQQVRTTESFKARFRLLLHLQTFPRNSLPVRLHSRCVATGRPHAYFRDFGLSRIALREFANRGFLPGITKASW